MATKFSAGNQVKKAFKGPAKLKLEAVGSNHVFTAMLNPDSFTIKYSDSTLKSQNSRCVQETVDGKKYEKKIVKLDFSIKLALTIDGTGAIQPPKGAGKLGGDFVTKQVEKFKKVAVYYNGKKHSTNPLKLVWGKGNYKVQLTSLDVSYTLFDRSGNPLRAKLDCSFSSYQNWEEASKKLKDQSPDLTHIRTVKAGDTLPLMCYRIYKDATYYPQVAKANQLRSIMDIRPGQRIYFPPLRVE